MRFELTTSTLARWRSTTELRPRRETRRGLSTWAPMTGKPNFANFPCSFFRLRVSFPARMSDKLAEIIATKHHEVAALMPRAALLRAGALQRNDFGGFRAALGSRTRPARRHRRGEKGLAVRRPDRSGLRSRPPGEALSGRRRVLPLDPHRREIFPRLAQLSLADLEIFRRAAAAQGFH